MLGARGEMGYGWCVCIGVKGEGVRKWVSMSVGGQG